MVATPQMAPPPPPLPSPPPQPPPAPPAAPEQMSNEGCAPAAQDSHHDLITQVVDRISRVVVGMYPHKYQVDVAFNAGGRRYAMKAIKDTNGASWSEDELACHVTSVARAFEHTDIKGRQALAKFKSEFGCP